MYQNDVPEGKHLSSLFLYLSCSCSSSSCCSLSYQIYVLESSLSSSCIITDTSEEQNISGTVFSYFCFASCSSIFCSCFYSSLSCLSTFYPSFCFIVFFSFQFYIFFLFVFSFLRHVLSLFFLLYPLFTNLFFILLPFFPPSFLVP